MSSIEPIVAIDLGGTRLRVALVDAEGNILDRHVEPTRGEEGPALVMGRVAETARGLLEKGGWSGPGAIAAAIASPMDSDGVLHYPPNLKGWEVVPVRTMLAERFDAPVWVGNDATLAALGVHVFGVGRGVDDMIYMTVSTGVGGGVISGGRLVTGLHGLAGEVGHIIIDRNGELNEACGHHGCLESLVSGTSIARRARQAIEGGRETSLAHLDEPEAVRAEHVFLAATQDDAFARALIEEVGGDLALGIASLVHVFNPRKFVLGGGVSQNWSLLEPIVRATLDRVLMAGFAKDLEIEISELGDDVGLVGAAAFVVSETGKAGDV